MSEAAKSIHPPSAAFAAAAHVDAEAYAKRYAASVADPEAFWGAEGLRLDQIGELMGIAKPTVNYHLRNIYQKSGASRQSDVINLLRAVHLAELPAGQAEQVGG